MSNDERNEFETSFVIDAAPELPKDENPYQAVGGLGDEVTGIRVIRNGETIREWGTAKESPHKTQTEREIEK